jgi:hypothetical protein
VSDLERFISQSNAQLERARSLPESATKTYRVSLLAYRLFFAETQLLAERGRIWRLEALNSIALRKDEAEKTAAIERHVKEARTEHARLVTRIDGVAKRLQPLVTDEHLREQFKRDLGRLRNDLSD